MAEVTRIAMWSGPRNISTAMMYAFGNRSDTFASDEPLYAHYLDQTGVTHPGADQVIASGDTDWRSVVSALTGPVPDCSAVWYQKHMCHHILPGMDLSWANDFHHCFLLRHPREVLLSLANKTDQIDARATGLPQQVELVREITARTGKRPLMVDARDIIRDPQRVLSWLCAEFGIGFQSQMLAWPKGPKSFDGVWARHWYDAVWASTEFAPYRPREGKLDDNGLAVLEMVLPLYESLSEGCYTDNTHRHTVD